MDTIPIRVPPLPGEALDSWLDAYAHRLQVYPADILDLAGMEAIGGRARRSLFARKPWLAELHPQEFSALARVTGVPTSQLAGMTLTRYIGSLLTVDPDTGTLDHSGWIRQTQPSRYCPTCLDSNGGRWKLEWRLPWSFACLEHHCLLIDHCPECGRQPRLRWGKLVRPVPGRCLATAPQADRTERKTRACFGRLADATINRLESGSAVLAAQRTVADVIAEIEETHATSPVALPGPLQALGDLHDSAQAAITALQLVPETPQRVTGILGCLALESGAQLTADRSRGGPLAADARAMAFGLTVARLFLIQGRDRPDPEIARWLLRTATHKSDGPTPSVVLKRWGGSSDTLRGALLKHLDAQLGP
ncbi:TniQ family protein [Streptomyces bauhiniae]|uniref:TniQ family protein n=1 Tax=Streptomyces bauhiniae TaxID=2340725 RepID=UPI003318E667